MLEEEPIKQNGDGFEYLIQCCTTYCGDRMTNGLQIPSFSCGWETVCPPFDSEESARNYISSNINNLVMNVGSSFTHCRVLKRPVGKWSVCEFDLNPVDNKGQIMV